jgi:site-specific recombinase XerD
MLTAGADIYTVSKVLGHTSLSSTQVYADIVDGKRRSAVDALAALVGDDRGTEM